MLVTDTTPPSSSRLINAVAEYFSLNRTQLTTGKRPRELHARTVAIYLITYYHPDLSLPDVAGLFSISVKTIRATLRKIDTWEMEWRNTNENEGVKAFKVIKACFDEEKITIVVGNEQQLISNALSIAADLSKKLYQEAVDNPAAFVAKHDNR